eukprot:4495415-Prymnesium_polylepis.1
MPRVAVRPPRPLRCATLLRRVAGHPRGPRRSGRPLCAHPPRPTCPCPCPCPWLLSGGPWSSSHLRVPARAHGRVRVR